MTPAEYLRALDRAATPGPWEIYDESCSECTREKLPASFGVSGLNNARHGMTKENAEFVIALRNLLPLLADVVEAAEKAHEVAYDPQIHTPEFGPQPTCTCGGCEAARILKPVLDRLTAAVAEVEGTK